jgi:hypothetical protein
LRRNGFQIGVRGLPDFISGGDSPGCNYSQRGDARRRRDPASHRLSQSTSSIASRKTSWNTTLGLVGLRNLGERGESGNPQPSLDAKPAPCWCNARLVSRGPTGCFFDLFPLSVLTLSTLEQLSELEPESRFDGRRFRMNVIVGTSEASMR